MKDVPVYKRVIGDTAIELKVYAKIVQDGKPYIVFRSPAGSTYRMPERYWKGEEVIRRDEIGAVVDERRKVWKAEQAKMLETLQKSFHRPPK